MQHLTLIASVESKNAEYMCHPTSINISPFRISAIDFTPEKQTAVIHFEKPSAAKTALMVSFFLYLSCLFRDLGVMCSSMAVPLTELISPSHPKSHMKTKIVRTIRPRLSNPISQELEVSMMSFRFKPSYG